MQRQGGSQSQTNSGDIGVRTRQPPTYLKDYFCHSVIKNPTYRSLENISKPSSGYPITKYIDYSHFSENHIAYLAAVSHQEEPRT